MNLYVYDLVVIFVEVIYYKILSNQFCLRSVMMMLKIIESNRDEVMMKYIIVNLLSFITLRRISKIENIKEKIKTRLENVNDI